MLNFSEKLVKIMMNPIPTKPVDVPDGLPALVGSRQSPRGGGQGGQDDPGFRAPWAERTSRTLGTGGDGGEGGWK